MELKVCGAFVWVLTQNRRSGYKAWLKRANTWVLLPEIERKSPVHLSISGSGKKLELGGFKAEFWLGLCRAGPQASRVGMSDDTERAGGHISHGTAEDFEEKPCQNTWEDPGS